MIHWYLSTYQVSYVEAAQSPAPGKTARPPGVCRTLPIADYIPVIPNVDGFKWSAAEIRGNRVLMKVSASAQLHAQLQADSRFTRLPGRDLTVVPPGMRTAIGIVLERIGYDLQEIVATNWQIDALLSLLTSGASRIELDATKRGIRILPSLRRTRRWEELDAEVQEA